MKQIYIILLLFLLPLANIAQVTEREFQALKALYNSTGGNNWTVKTGWDNINTTATRNDVTSAWKGLKVENGSVTEINFTSNNLVGYIPPQIGDFPELTRIYLDTNPLYGSIPSEIGKLVKLNTISLSSTTLSGPLPSSFGDLKALKNIYMANIPLNCEFPNDIISKLTTLEYVQMENCGFTGSVGDIFEKHKMLGSLSLTSNKLTGILPPSLNKLKNLNSLYFGSNKFTGNLLSLDSCLNKIYYVTFDVNQFSGKIPSTYNKFMNLKYLHINDNQLYGEIPDGLLTTIFVRLYIGNNYFTFADIEPVFDKINSLWQKNFISNKLYPLLQTSVNINEGQTLTLNAATLSKYPLGGNNNRYKWYRNNVEVFSGNSPIYSVTNAKTSNAGVYRLEVTNTVVTGMTIKSEDILVNVLVAGNKAPTDITFTPGSVDENTTGTNIYLNAVDPDVADTHVFSLSPGNGTNDRDNGKFQVFGNMLRLVLPVNFESSHTLNVFLSANDTKGGVFTKQITINVNDLNEAPEFINQMTNSTIDETAPNGTNVLVLTASDPEGLPVTYSIQSGNENGAFGISGNKLVVANNTKLNYDQKNQYQIVIEASDGTLSSTSTLKVTLSKINKMPVVTNSVFSINENSPAGTPVGIVTASDPEGSLLVYTLISGNDLTAFRLNGNKIEVNNTLALDFDVKPVFNLVVNVSDGISNVPALITINLRNLADETGNNILSFNVPGISGTPVIDNINHTITATISKSDITALNATFGISNGATANPVSGSVFNFFTPKTITVTSETGASAKWTITVSYITNIHPVENQAIEVFPNPIFNYLYVKGLSEKTPFKIYNLNGILVASGIVTGNDYQIDLGQLHTGVYFLELQSAGGPVVRKLIK